jgi:hypothetical protein
VVRLEVTKVSATNKPNRLPSAATSITLPSTVVRDLVIWIDSGLIMSPEPPLITKVVAGCCAVLRQLHGVRKSLSRESLTSLVVAC